MARDADDKTAADSDSPPANDEGTLAQSEHDRADSLAGSRTAMLGSTHLGSTAPKAADETHPLPPEPAAPLDGTALQDADSVRKARDESVSSKDKDSAPLHPPGYKLMRKLGEGTFGEVWLAQQLFQGTAQDHSKILVAIKFFSLKEKSQMQRMVDEAKILARLRSDPRIVYLVDQDAEATPPYFVMDYAEKGSLAARLGNDDPLPLHHALAIFRDIVEAMAFVHAKGIRHCDLKPGNILIDAAGRPKVADFGQAHLSIEPTALALGTFFYMAPEQASAERQVPDTRWDVYGLGALFYAMLTGKPPRYSKQFREELANTASMSTKLKLYREWVEKSEPPREHHKVKGMDRLLADIVDRCLTVDPEARLPNAGDLLAALSQRERRRRMRPLLTFAVLAPLLLMISVGVFGYMMVRYAVNQAESDLKQRVMKSDLITANLVANVVRDNLDLVADTITNFSRSEKLRTLLDGYLSDRSEKNLRELEKFLELLGEYRAFRFNLLAVYDHTGTLHAAYTRNPAYHKTWEQKFVREIQGRDYQYRDYWNGQQDYYEEPAKSLPHKFRSNRGVYIGQPYVSTVDEKFLAITVSAPIFENPKQNPPGKMVGLILGTIKLDDLNAWVDPVEVKGGCAVWIDRRGYCLHHQREHRAKLKPAPSKAPVKPEEIAEKAGNDAAAAIYRKLLSGVEGFEENFVDPYDGETYLAAFVPEKQFGGGVLVLHHREQVLGETEQIRAELYRFVWVAGGVSGLILSAFWGWLLWILMRKERVTATA